MELDFKKTKIEASNLAIVTDGSSAGSTIAIIKYTDQSCDVAPFSEKYTPMKDIPIVSAATGFTSENGRDYILVFHEALYMPDTRNTLINPNQC